MLKGKVETVYTWDDVEATLNSIMGKEDKDLWDFWLNDILFCEIINGCIIRYWFEFSTNMQGVFKKNHKEKIYKALKTLHDELDNPESILIEYSW